MVGFIFLNMPVGIGTGMLFPATMLSIQAACDPTLNGQAAALFSLDRAFGQAIDVALRGAIFQNGPKRELRNTEMFALVAVGYSRDASMVVNMVKRHSSGREHVMKQVLREKNKRTRGLSGGASDNEMGNTSPTSPLCCIGVT